MKYLKAGVVAVMILAVSGTAGAVSLKPGPAFFHAENWDMATSPTRSFLRERSPTRTPGACSG